MGCRKHVKDPPYDLLPAVARMRGNLGPNPVGNLGYLGRLAGHKQTYEVMADPVLRDYTTRLMDEEVRPLLPLVEGVDLAKYPKTLRERFAEHVVPAVRADQSFICVDTATVAEEEVKYTVDSEGFVHQLSKTVVRGLSEAIGTNYVSAGDKHLLIEHLGQCNDSDYFERAIETGIAQHGMRFRPLDISAFAAVEVDFEEDLVRANLKCLPVDTGLHHHAELG